MMPHESLSVTLQQLGQKLLGDALVQAEQLGTDNNEALHDFRVALRRLRSFLKSFEGSIKGAKKHRQKLSAIMDLTNAGRDNEVHVAWLTSKNSKAKDPEKTGLDFILEHLTSSDHVDLEEVNKEFAGAAKKLGKVFSSDKHIKAGESLTFAAASADVLKDYRDELRDLLQHVQTPEDDTIHEARIVGKRLRYTLELLEGKEAKKLVKQLKTMQDLMGDLHDLQVLEPKVDTLLYAETILWSQTFREHAKTRNHQELQDLPELQRSYGLAEVSRKIAEGKNELYQELGKTWLGEASATFFAEVDALVQKLGGETQPEQQATEEKPLKQKTKKSRKTLRDTPEA
jgi:CHAD domain-containing protein